MIHHRCSSLQVTTKFQRCKRGLQWDGDGWGESKTVPFLLIVTELGKQRKAVGVCSKNDMIEWYNWRKQKVSLAWQYSLFTQFFFLFSRLDSGISFSLSGFLCPKTRNRIRTISLTQYPLALTFIPPILFFWFNPVTSFGLVFSSLPLFVSCPFCVLWLKDWILLNYMWFMWIWF